MESHYVCSECAYTSKVAGTCQNDACIRQGTRLSECHCDDGRHALVMNPYHEGIPQTDNEQDEDARHNEYSTNTIDLDNLPEDK